MPRIMFRPIKENAVFSAITGLIMVGIGIFVVIPNFGTFGVFWTLFAIAFVGYNAYIVLSDKDADSEVHIEETFESGNRNLKSVSPNFNTESRLEKLENLKLKSLITEDEYRKKREEILREL